MTTQVKVENDLELIRLVGTVKDFDTSKGYGWIIPDDKNLPNALLHSTVLRAAGYRTAYNGARVYCQALKRPKGFQVFRILQMGTSADVIGP